MCGSSRAIEIKQKYIVLVKQLVKKKTQQQQQSFLFCSRSRHWKNDLLLSLCVSLFLVHLYFYRRLSLTLSVNASNAEKFVYLILFGCFVVWSEKFEANRVSVFFTVCLALFFILDIYFSSVTYSFFLSLSLKT